MSKYSHIKSFVDLDEAAKILGEILQRHFEQFGGYSNKQLLFNAASEELSMFINDNGCESAEDIYAVARFLFDKKFGKEKLYKFYNQHIFKDEPDYPMSTKGLMIHLARNNGGILHVGDAKNYLQKLMFANRGFSERLQINSSDTFLAYDADRYLLSETIGIDDAWCRRLYEHLDGLFSAENVAYIVPRDITDAWFETLPALPQNLKWTRLLLQEILKKYPATGFKCILPKPNCNHQKLVAAFVPINSPLQSFPDVVTLFMQGYEQLPVRMSAGSLQKKLRVAGMVANSELLLTLHKVLNDYRFAWSFDKKTVYVRGNR